ncbi:amidase [Nonomuraea angiospora]|uniref:amidase n=1 Tax=Nonomuraea angiospora TaxID=46172 RepID=UPI0029ACEF09|nr:amidase [Nonomuraea angiospora]MDX3103365.1 amidase [Nonomuraea angiospora]
MKATHDAVLTALDWLEAVDGELHAFVEEPGRRDRVLAEHRRAWFAYRATKTPPPLLGVPVAVKDVFHVAGLPTRAGSAMDPVLLTGPESVLVRRVREAGGVVLGKTHMDEFACCEPGPTRNPHDPTRTPGGSSAGSAAAVAAGVCPIAMGSQTQRSVIVPAAYCGVAGYKPTPGLVPFDGVPMAPSIDTAGLFTANLPDMLSAAAALYGVTAVRPADPPRLAVPGGAFLDPVSEPALQAFAGQVTALRTAGAHIEERDVPWGNPQPWLHAFDAVLLSELAAVHEKWFGAHAGRYRPRTAAAIRAGQAVPAERVAAARRRIDGLGSLISASAAGTDAWICPSALGPAPRGLAHTGDVEMTLFWSWAGLPCVNVPAGKVSPGDGPAMPIGLQVIGRHGGDAAALGIAAWIAGALSGEPT